MGRRFASCILSLCLITLGACGHDDDTLRVSAASDQCVGDECLTPVPGFVLPGGRPQIVENRPYTAPTFAVASGVVDLQRSLLGGSERARMVYDGEHFSIVYSTRRTLPNYTVTDVHYARLRADGTVIAGPVMLENGRGRGVTALATLNERTMVFWTTVDSIRSARLERDGSVTILKDIDTYNEIFDVSVAANTTSLEFLLAFKATTSGTHVYAQRFDRWGLPAGPAVAIGVAERNYERVRISATTTGYAVSWTGSQRFLNLLGVPLREPIEVPKSIGDSADTDYDGQRTRVVANTLDGIIVSTLDSGGRLATPDVALSPYSGGVPGPAITSLNTSHAVVWQGRIDGEEGRDLIDGLRIAVLGPDGKDPCWSAQLFVVGDGFNNFQSIPIDVAFDGTYVGVLWNANGGLLYRQVKVGDCR